MDDQIRHRLLCLLSDEPQLSQRQLARRLGLSLGKTNYCLRALIDKGWVKVRNFTGSRHKLAYMYLLTPRGMSAKARITRRFLARKLAEYEQLEQEIAELRAQVAEIERHPDRAEPASDQ
ncbi:MAG: MarR family EPS-associated transcriptional regulator [Wenzhouxiangellaceae bacterium]